MSVCKTFYNGEGERADDASFLVMQTIKRVFSPFQFEKEQMLLLVFIYFHIFASVNSSRGRKPYHKRTSVSLILVSQLKKRPKLHRATERQAIGVPLHSRCILCLVLSVAGYLVVPLS